MPTTQVTKNTLGKGISSGRVRGDSPREGEPNVNKAAHLRGLRVRDDVRRDPTVGASSEKELVISSPSCSLSLPVTALLAAVQSASLLPERLLCLRSVLCPAPISGGAVLPFLHS